jgi:hypothetical protein
MSGAAELSLFAAAFIAAYVFTEDAIGGARRAWQRLTRRIAARKGGSPAG